IGGPQHSLWRAAGQRSWLSQARRLTWKAFCWRPVCVDLGDWGATEEALREAGGNLNLLVNNVACVMLEPFLEVTPDQFDISFNINVKVALHVSQVRGGHLKCATKGALDMLTKVMALELGPYQVTSWDPISVNPTVVMTEMGRLGWRNPDKANTMTSRIPLVLDVDGVVNSILLFLLSDKSSMTNGVTLTVDRGFLAC
ncbi:unnamed protein product, partial [Coregonus sp. 'balchen']